MARVYVTSDAEDEELLEALGELRPRLHRAIGGQGRTRRVPRWSSWSTRRPGPPIGSRRSSAGWIPPTRGLPEVAKTAPRLTRRNDVAGRGAGPAGPDGIVVIDKEAGWTSHDVVAKARGVLGQ